MAAPLRYALRVLAADELNALANLAAAGAHRNRFKGDFVTGEAAVFGGEHRLFNPRSDHGPREVEWILAARSGAVHLNYGREAMRGPYGIVGVVVTIVVIYLLLRLLGIV